MQRFLQRHADRIVGVLMVAEVLRFLGRRTNAGSVLRIETTINNPERFKVRREVTRRGRLEVAWVLMRKSVADIARRVDICRAANERYLEALGVVGEPSPTRRVLDPVSRRVMRDGRAYRALRPIEAEEARLFSTLLASDFALQGFRNHTLRQRLLPEGPPDDDARRKASGRVTRLLRLLRTHKLIRKVPGTLSPDERGVFGCGRRPPQACPTLPTTPSKARFSCFAPKAGTADTLECLADPPFARSILDTDAADGGTMGTIPPQVGLNGPVEFYSARSPKRGLAPSPR
jgi:hypothetical protein